MNIANFKLPGGGLKGVYCNDKYLVLATNGVPSHTSGLQYIPRPPGSSGVSYESACVTRSYHEQIAYFKVPLYPRKLPTASATNNMEAFVGQTDPPGFSSHGLPESGAASVTVSGQSMFPVYNNEEAYTPEKCEIDKCSAHAGQGFDYHYHGDPFDPTPGKCMYSPDDYGTDLTAHPPLIAWGLDGYKTFGRHLSNETVGWTVALDVCGGHEHNDTDGTVLDYHYHSQVLNLTSDSNSINGVGRQYYAYVGGVHQCWRGNISGLNFFNNDVAFESRADFQDLRPCCGMTEYYTASGYTINGAAASSPTSSPTSLSTTGTSLSPPTASPTDTSTATPTEASTAAPTDAPTTAPTLVPTLTPTQQPTPGTVIIASFNMTQTLSNLPSGTTNLTAAQKEALLSALGSVLSKQSVDVRSLAITTVNAASTTTARFRRQFAASATTSTLSVGYSVSTQLPQASTQSIGTAATAAAVVSTVTAAASGSEFLTTLQSTATATSTSSSLFGNVTVASIATTATAITSVTYTGSPSVSPTAAPSVSPTSAPSTVLSSQSASSSSSSSSSKTNGGATAGAVVGSIGGALLIGGALYYSGAISRKKKEPVVNEYELPGVELEHVYDPKDRPSGTTMYRDGSGGGGVGPGPGHQPEYRHEVDIINESPRGGVGASAS
jgi:hypothetical protein